MNGGTISNNNAQRDGGGIFMGDFGTLSNPMLLITTTTNSAFSGNTAGTPYWLGNTTLYPDSSMYNPGVMITIGNLKGLHGTTAAFPIRRNSGSNGLSASPASMPNFTFLANNFDLNFNGDEIYESPILESVPTDIFFGTGTIPTRYTLFGLKDGFGIQNPSSHRINNNANNVSDIKFNIRNPIGATWSLNLHCTPFYIRDHEGEPIPGSPGMRSVAVSRSGVINPNAFFEDGTIRMYSSADFRADLNAGLVEYNIPGGRMGTWAWDRFRHDIKVEAQPGMGVINDTYVSIFTWTMINAP